MIQANAQRLARAETRSSAVRHGIEAANDAGKAAGEIFSAGFLESEAQAIAVAIETQRIETEPQP